jgi:2-oxoglutarate dehydrogenase E2 component (dihydrolipoamide succinyltransferase)
MSQLVTMPQLGETVTEGTVLRWLVNVGDEVKEDDPILEISTDKVDTEVPSPFSGKVTALLVEEGETVEVGASLLELDGEGSQSENSDEQPEIVDSQASQDDTNKKNIEEVEEEKKENDAIPQKVIAKESKQKLSPVVRRLASENNVDLDLIAGSGPNGRITRKDIESALNSEKPTKKINDTKTAAKENPTKTEHVQSESIAENISRLRKRIAENMIMSKQTSAHVMTSVEVDFENVEIYRSSVKKKFKNENGYSLTYLPFISLATIHALKNYPTVNSSFDLEKNLHTLHGHINLGIAVDINQEGLLVGTIKNADNLNVKGLASNIFDISNLLRDGKFGLEDVSGSTFTISNNGSFNSFITSPIINQPNVAILSTESVKKRPVVIDSSDGTDSIAIRHTGILSLTWDHRVFDGSIALLFLNSIKEKLEKTDLSQEII